MQSFVAGIQITWKRAPCAQRFFLDVLPFTKHPLCSTANYVGQTKEGFQRAYDIAQSSSVQRKEVKYSVWLEGEDLSGALDPSQYIQNA